MSRKAGLIAKINDAAARYIGALKGAAQNVIDNMNGSISGSIGNINDYLEKINKFINTINEHLKNDFYYNNKVKDLLRNTELDVLGGKMTSFVAAKRLLDTYYEDIRNNR